MEAVMEYCVDEYETVYLCYKSTSRIRGIRGKLEKKSVKYEEEAYGKIYYGIGCRDNQ